MQKSRALPSAIRRHAERTPAGEARFAPAFSAKKNAMRMNWMKKIDKDMPYDKTGTEKNAERSLIFRRL